VLEHQPHRPFPYFGRISSRLFHDSILSRNGVSGKAGAVHDPDAIVIAEVLSKKSGQTTNSTIELCKKRLKEYDSEAGQETETRR
jgi:hypothetical protein